ncbi:MAG: hypothetical protein LQ347_005952 [Umbilicaria vellea]|nr:MAG: hypothetical protein LQ347_005952 [Umbilicaria vellea]
MIYLPPLRRFLLPALVLLALVVFYRSSLRVPTSIPSFVLHQPPPPPKGIHIPIADLGTNVLPIQNTSENHLPPPKEYFYSYTEETNTKSSNSSVKTSTWAQPILNPNLAILFKCPTRPNRYTNHVRLPNSMYNISDTAPNSLRTDTRVFWNPTIISLPYWSQNQYLVVSRIVTDGNHQTNVLCEANICYVGDGIDARIGEKACTPDDLDHVGPAGGMRCVSTPVTLSVPPTPAERCEGKFGTYVDIPGFHDPRIFWSGKGEPLMMVNTQSRYACFGLWLIDLRSLYPPLHNLLSSNPDRPSLGPLKSYPTLTELTRNPADTRSAIEKNWMFFYPASGESYIHYDLSNPHGGPRGRTFAKVLGNGLTTTNLTDRLELPCLRGVDPDDPDAAKKNGTWHQATNSLRLVLCSRSDTTCKPDADNTVFFAIVHRKHPNFLKLPLRYERYFIVWSAVPPFSMLGISQHPVLMANETASGWSAAQNWHGDQVRHKRVTNSSVAQPGEEAYWAYFTYTVSIAYAWGRKGDDVTDKNVGYLDDEVILGIGIDDAGQGFATVKAGDLLQCLRACPGRGAEKAVVEVATAVQVG